MGWSLICGTGNFKLSGFLWFCCCVPDSTFPSLPRFLFNSSFLSFSLSMLRYIKFSDSLSSFLFSLDTHRTFTQQILLSLSQILTYPNVQKLVITSFLLLFLIVFFFLWPLYELHSCSCHIFMTCSVSVALNRGCTICLLLVWPDTFLSLELPNSILKKEMQMTWTSILVKNWW